MQSSEDPQTKASVIASGVHPDSHYQPLKDAIPDWLGNASSARRQALKNTRPQRLGRLNQAPPAEHLALKTLNGQHWVAQTEVDKRLQHLQDANAFAEPLLSAVLKQRFGVEVDVKTTFVRLYVPVTIPWFPVRTGSRTWTVSLLDAALHNFEEKETAETAYETDSTYITQPSPTGQFDTLPLIKSKMSIPAFAKLCRELDIGRQYTGYLEDTLGFSNPVAAAELRFQVDTSQKAALKAALQMARMNGDISQSYARLIEGVADGLQGMRLNGQAILCHTVTMLSAQLTGIVVFAPDLEQSRSTARVVAYIPDDPEHPIKEYASPLEMVIELTRQLRSKDYQRFFSRFVNREHLSFFFSSLNDRLSTIKWHPPVAGSAEPTWRETAVDRPNLQTAFVPFGDDLWQHLYQAKLNKILNDARSLAVPTASVDQKARWAIWDSLVSIASSILQTAAFIIAPFVPVLGEAMMAYMAYQLLDETFEGIVEWAQGRTTEAFEHLMGTVESLIQLGAFAVGGTIAIGEFRKVLPKEIIAFIDRFKPVELANGQSRYWQPDLSRYRQQSAPASHSTPNAMGLHAHQGKQLLTIDGDHFAVRETDLADRYQIEHPTRADAYRPTVRHNGDGAWHTELESPLAWDKTTALRRIGHSVESFSAAQRERMLQVSGYNGNALRKMHVNQESLPPLLADTVQRFKIDQDLHTFIEQMDSDAPEHFLKADPLTQLQLLTEHGQWPAGKRLSLVDLNGETLWQSSSDESLALTVLDQANLRDGDVLKTLLQSLDEQSSKTLLGEAFGGPMFALDVRVARLRKQLARLTRQHRTALFEARYAALKVYRDPLEQRITQHDAQLPASIARELLTTATSEEWLQLSEGQLPARQQQLLPLARQEVRVTRAYEGLELESVSNPDTDTLALHSLKNLPGWTREVRLEIRDRRFEGALLDSTGRVDAPVRKVLVRTTDGRYQPFDERGQELQAASDFYTSVVFALPDAERQALGIQIGQGQALKNAIREHPVERGELRLAIANPPAEGLTVDTLRLVGNAGYRPIEPIVPTEPFTGTVTQNLTPEGQVQRIYPGFSSVEARALVARLHLDPVAMREALGRLTHEYSRLVDDLRTWERAVPQTHPETGLALTPEQTQAARQNRRLFRAAVESSWRRETRGLLGVKLDLLEPILGELPALNADFSHVIGLRINGSVSTGPLEPFLQRFPGLLILDAQHFNLQQLPASISTMPRLRQLIVRDGGITLSTADQQLLSSLTDLSLLDLQDNPLATTLDIRPMRSLVHLNLANTGMVELPIGLLEAPQPIIGRFDGNQLSELPDAVFSFSSERSDAFEFANNPLSVTARDKVKAHYQRTGKHFGVLPERADIERTAALFPELGTDQATNLLYRLPGTLADSRAQLARWEAESTQLKEDLSRWARDVPERDVVSGMPMNINEQFNEQRARRTFAKLLELAWSNKLNDSLVSSLSFMGDMPAVSADFSHIESMTLTGNAGISSTDAFLQQFANLRSLDLRDFAFDQVPNALESRSRLDNLTLDDCGLVWTAESQAVLFLAEQPVKAGADRQPVRRGPGYLGVTPADLPRPVQLRYYDTRQRPSGPSRPEHGHFPWQPDHRAARGLVPAARQPQRRFSVRRKPFVGG